MSVTRDRAKIKVRKKLSGTTEKPRLTIYRSNSKIYAQLIDDSKGVTLVSASSLSSEILEDVKSAKGKIAISTIVGTLLAKRALEKNISTVVFDRNGYKYHGRVKAVAEAARAAGLKI